MKTEININEMSAFDYFIRSKYGEAVLWNNGEPTHPLYLDLWCSWQASAQRDGYKLVPVETTAKQNREGVKKFVRHRNENTWSCDAIDDIYKAMIGAADEIN